MSGAAPPQGSYDAVVIGAGFGGLRMLWELRRRGLSARVLEAGSDVGGTWFWNHYPGARTDSESWAYCFSFDKELEQEWTWSARFAAQPEVHAYLRHVADRFDLRRDIEFGARVAEAAFDEATGRWRTRTESGRVLESTYLIAATGFLSEPYAPPFPGLETFAGECYQSQRWPSEPVDLTRKRVGVIGTGATGVQLIPELAHSAEHLTVFQRTPTYVIPSRNHPLEAHQQASIKREYNAVWETCARQVFAFPIERANRRFADCSPDEQQRILAAGWERGGFRFIFETFDDLTANAACNAAAAEFVREKIRAIVKDPVTAERLCPHDHPIGAKRIPLGHHYYETYNRPHVELVSLRESPIDAVTAGGVRLADGTEHPLDVLVLALGFDAATGALTRMTVRGPDGQTLRDAWSGGPHSYLGLCVRGFPNLFTIAGPHCPILNVPVLVERQASWIGHTLSHMREQGLGRIEPTAPAVARWGEHIDELLQATLLSGAAAVNSYYVGANIPGKAQAPQFFFGGAPKYFREIEAAIDSGYEGFDLAAAGAAPVTAHH